VQKELATRDLVIRGLGMVPDIKIPTRPTTMYEQGSSVSIVSGYGLGDLAIEVRFPAEARELFL
jgi:hypothetical protein